MKKILALILCAIASTDSSILNATDLPNPIKTSQNKMFVRFLEVQTIPPVRVTQIPSKRKIILDGGLISPVMNLSCKTYNGIPTTGPINLSYDMSREQIIAALLFAFGNDKKIKISEDMISKED